MSDIHRDLDAYIKNGGSKDIVPDFSGNVDYENVNVQRFYLLKYMYAYILEYHFLYKNLKESFYNVVSFGCGAFLDLYGLFYANFGCSISYLGVDSVIWKDVRIPNGVTISFYQKKFDDFLDYVKLNNLENQLFENKNFFVFPKSIEYLNVDKLCDCLNNVRFFSSNMVYLVVNGMSENFQGDEAKIDKLKNLFVKKGYKPYSNLYDGITNLSGMRNTFVELPEHIEFEDKIDDWLNKTFAQSIMHNTDSFKYKIWKLKKIDATLM